MTVTDITNRLPHVTPKRPTVTTPVLDDGTEDIYTFGAPPALGREDAEKHIAALDEDLDCVFCVAATLAGTQDVPDEAVNSLKTLHARMKRNVEALYNLG